LILHQSYRGPPRARQGSRALARAAGVVRGASQVTYQPGIPFEPRTSLVRREPRSDCEPARRKGAHPVVLGRGAGTRPYRHHGGDLCADFSQSGGCGAQYVFVFAGQCRRCPDEAARIIVRMRKSVACRQVGITSKMLRTMRTIIGLCCLEERLEEKRTGATLHHPLHRGPREIAGFHGASRQRVPRSVSDLPRSQRPFNP
jgi:hypothetical protein